VGGGAVDGELLARALPAGGAERDLAAAGEIIGGEAAGAGEELVERARADDFAAVDSRAGAHVDDMIGGPDRFLVMLDDVEDPREAAADLAGEADALAFAARQSAAGAVEVEIVEPDIVKEAQALVDLLEDGLGDFVLGRRELLVERREPAERVGDRAARALRNVLTGDLYRQRLGLEAGAVADFAGLG